MNNTFQIKRFTLLSLIFLSWHLCVFGEVIYDIPKAASKTSSESLKPYLLPKDHPLIPKLKDLFKNRKMFKTPKEFRKEGFHLNFGHRRLMVASHPKIEGYLIKKFPDAMSKEKQLENYIKRIKGANIIRNCIEEKNCKHLIVPQKWLYKTPYGYVLIVEKMDIYDLKETNRRYFQIDEEVLAELCEVLHAIGGCDAFTRNQPFTKSGKIAFVDTEHVGQKKDAFNKHILPLLRPDMQDFAMSLIKKLDRDLRRQQ